MLHFVKKGTFSFSPSWWPTALDIVLHRAKPLHHDAAPWWMHDMRVLQQLWPPVGRGYHTRRGYLWGSILRFHHQGLRAPQPRGVTSCPGLGCMLQAKDLSWGHCEGKRGRDEPQCWLIYPHLNVPATRKFLLSSVQRAFICL